MALIDSGCRDVKIGGFWPKPWLAKDRLLCRKEPEPLSERNKMDSLWRVKKR